MPLEGQINTQRSTQAAVFDDFLRLKYYQGLFTWCTSNNLDKVDSPLREVMITRVISLCSEAADGNQNHDSRFLCAYLHKGKAIITQFIDDLVSLTFIYRTFKEQQLPFQLSGNKLDC